MSGSGSNSKMVGGKLLRRETVSRRRRILFTGFQLCRRKVRVIWRIWKVLCLEAETGPMLVNGATLAFVRRVQKITAIKLQARLGRHDFHEYSRGRLIKRSDQLQVSSLSVEHPVMIVTSTKLQLLVLIPDPSSDRGRLGEIERCARDGSQLPGWNQALVDGGELVGLDHQFVPQDVAGSSIFQVEVGMVSKIDNGRLIRLGGVLDLQTVLVRQSVSNRTTEIARKAFFPIFA